MNLHVCEGECVCVCVRKRERRMCASVFSPEGGDASGGYRICLNNFFFSFDVSQNCFNSGGKLRSNDSVFYTLQHSM